MGARVIRPPAALELAGGRGVFLAGSIEMGQAEDWQERVTRGLEDLDVVILNPRREEWDASWEQKIENPVFRGQVEWEMEALERTELILMYLAPGTRSPISLLELGLFARGGKMIVSCPEGFYRKGNVDIVCHRYGVQQASGIEDLIAAARRRLF